MGSITELKNKSRDISVLCIDDDDVIRESLGRILGGIFPRVALAANGTEALELFENSLFDVVLVDIIMPKMNGIETARKIRQLGEDTAVIFLSASNETNYFLDAIELHADGFIIKPIDMQKMMGTFSKVVDGIHSRMLAKQYDQELENRVIFEMQKNIENTKIMLQQSRLAQIGEMITAIAHQWKEPLSVITQVTQDLPDAYKYGELNEGYMNAGLEKIGFQVEYMEHMIDDFRNFFKTDKSKEHFTFLDVIDPVMTLMGNTMELANIAVDTYGISDKIVLHSYKNELKQVIINLLNYARSSFDRGNITNKKVTIGLHEDECNVYVSFRHNAGSVSEAVLGSIFEFDFEHPETNSIDGIGLYLSKKIVTQNLGGDIVAHNDNDGVLFVIRLNKEA